MFNNHCKKFEWIWVFGILFIITLVLAMYYAVEDTNYRKYDQINAIVTLEHISFNIDHYDVTNTMTIFVPHIHEQILGITNVAIQKRWDKKEYEAIRDSYNVGDDVDIYVKLDYDVITFIWDELPALNFTVDNSVTVVIIDAQWTMFQYYWISAIFFAGMCLFYGLMFINASYDVDRMQILNTAQPQSQNTSI